MSIDQSAPDVELTEREQELLNSAALGDLDLSRVVAHIIDGRSAGVGRTPGRPIEQEFAVVVAALLAGRIDGQQAVTSLTAIHERES